MTASRKSTDSGWQDPDDAPDLSAAPWVEKLSETRVRRGRPPAARVKISTTIRLDADILDHFRAEGSGWQSRINAVLRAWLSEHEKT